MERLEAKVKSLASEKQSMIKEMHHMLVAMHSHLDQIVGNQNCDHTKSSHNQGEMERSNDQTKYGPTSSSCVISPKVAKLDSSCFNGTGGSQNSSKDCKSL